MWDISDTCVTVSFETELLLQAFKTITVNVSVKDIVHSLLL